MSEFYEPMLYLSTPDHPNTMGVLAVLKEAVDGELLREVVEELRTRFPYFYVKAESRGNDLVPVPNALSMTVRDSWAPIRLNAEESNYHLAAWKYEGKRLAFEISHSLTDGAGVLPYFKSALYLYLSRRTGQSFDPTGFRLPGDEIPESETGNPFAGLNIDGAEEPLYRKETEKDFFRLNDGTESDARVTYIKLSEAQLMQYCRDFDGSPNAFLAVMLARAARRYDSASEKTVSVAIAIDHKAMLGNRDNYRMFANIVELDFPKSRPLDDLMKACTMARGQVMLQAQPENSLWAMKQRKLLYAKLEQMPLEMKLGVIAKSAGSPRWSISISYANSRTFGPLDPYIEELYMLAELGVSDIMCEIACLNHCFFLAVGQNFSSNQFVDAVLNELASVGIDYEVMGREPLRLCGLEAYSAMGGEEEGQRD
jgi:hypothetical protein